MNDFRDHWHLRFAHVLFKTYTCKIFLGPNCNVIALPTWPNCESKLFSDPSNAHKTFHQNR